MYINYVLQNGIQAIDGTGVVWAWFKRASKPRKPAGNKHACCACQKGRSYNYFNPKILQPSSPTNNSFNSITSVKLLTKDFFIITGQSSD